jgi:energy-coupling factor transporter ATP-binding protein EcfA2
MGRVDDFSPKTIETLAKRVGYRCSNPHCPKWTIGPHTELTKTVNIGVAAHITAAAPGGKRYDASLSSEQRKSIKNGVWLCQSCSKLIDSDEQQYPVDLLRSWKHQAERRAQSEVERSTSESFSSEPTRFKLYLESVIAYYQYWWKDYAFMDEINEQTWFDFPLSSTTKDKAKDKLQNSERQPKDQPPQLVLDAIRDYASEKILIMGAPGAGKSTLLAQVLRIAAEKAEKEPNAPIPVLIELRDFKATDNHATIPGLIIKSLKSHDYSLNDDTLTSLLTGTGRRLLLLVDGLNEKPDAKRDLKQFCRNIPLIATGRNDGDGWEIERKLELQPLSKNQVAEFFQKLLPNAEQAQLQASGDRVQDFGQTPLMVWMLYSIFRANRPTPATRGEAYRAFTTLYTERAKENLFELTESRVLLGKLAFEMMRSRNPDDPTDFELKIFEVDAQRILGGEETLKRMLNHLLGQRGNPGNLEISFCHQSLQEYYAAEHLLSELQKHPEWLEKDGEEYSWFQHHYLNYTKWTEPIALMLGLPEVGQTLAKKVVEQALAMDLMLGARLAGNTREHSSQEKYIEFLVNSSSSPILQCKLLGETRSQAAIPYLANSLKNKDWNVRLESVKALGSILGQQSRNHLIGALQDKHSVVRGSAARSLGRIGVKEDAPHLEPLLSETLISVRFEAEQALIQLGIRQPTNDKSTEIINISEEDIEFFRECGFIVKVDKRREPLRSIGEIQKNIESKDPESRRIVRDYTRIIKEIGEQAKGDSGWTKEFADPKLLKGLWERQLISNSLDYLDAIAAIQANCKFYNHEIFHAPPAKPQPTQQSPIPGSPIIYGDYIKGDKIAGDKIAGDKINQLGNLNTGPVTIQGNQIGEQTP